MTRSESDVQAVAVGGPGRRGHGGAGLVRPGAPRARRRRLALALTLILAPGAAACDPAGDAAPVAWVDDWTLTQERLADLLVLAQPLPLDSATVGALVDEWISMAAMAQRVGAGADLEGQEAVDASLWLERREAVLEAERRARLGDAMRVTPDQARATFQADTLLLLAHVLLRTSAFTSDAERDLQRRTAQGVLDGLLAGGGWAEAVAQSEDAETREASGLLGLLRADELPPRLRVAAESLEPGQVSSVVESPRGYHILYRPRLEDVADLYASLLSDRLLAAADSAANRQVRDSLGVVVSADGVEGLRALTRDPETAIPGPLATWDGGALGVDVAAPYVAALPGEARGRLSGAPDEAAVTFLEELAVREARLQGAAKAGIAADQDTREGLMEMHRTDVQGWREDLSDGAPAFSRQAVDRYMERLVARRAPVRPVPPLLRRWLLEPLSWGRDPGAQDAAAASARRLIAAADGTEPGS